MPYTDRIDAIERLQVALALAELRPNVNPEQWDTVKVVDALVADVRWINRTPEQWLGGDFTAREFINIFPGNVDDALRKFRLPAEHA